MQMVTIYKTGCNVNAYMPKKAPDLQTGPKSSHSAWKHGGFSTYSHDSGSESDSTSSERSFLAFQLLGW